MSGPMLDHADVFAKAKQLRAAGVPLKEIDAYLTQKLGNQPTPTATAPHSKFTPLQLVGRANRAVENAQDDLDSTEPSYPQKALGGIAALARDIPGAEAAQAGVRSLVRGQPYRDARDDIRRAEDAAPAGVRDLNRIAGGGLAAATIPGASPLAGARYGMLHALTQSDPDADAKQRVDDAAIEGSIGAATGFVGGKLAGTFRPSAINATPAPAPPSPAAPSALMRDEARSKLQQLLQETLQRDARPTSSEPPTNWNLMERMERGLNPRDRIVPLVRPKPLPVGLVAQP